MIGAYAFVTSDYVDLDYPLDLWIEWNSKLFDRISIVTYGSIEINCPENVEMKRFESPPSPSSFDFYLKGKTYAQQMLKTDWKVALDVDEFVNSRIDTNRFKKGKAYPIKMRHLYGNLCTEIMNTFPSHYYRIHYGNRKVIGDGGDVSQPYSQRILFKNLARDILHKLMRNDNMVNPFSPKPNEMIEVWHTGALRRPEAMSKKWRTQIKREMNSGIVTNESRLSILDVPFDYHNFKGIDSNATLRKIGVNEVPEILRKNVKRFHYIDFDDNEYSMAP